MKASKMKVTKRRLLQKKQLKSFNGRPNCRFVIPDAPLLLEFKSYIIQCRKLMVLVS